MKRMPYMSVRSEGPSIVKFLKNVFARKSSRDSSRISPASGSWGGNEGPL